MGLLRLRKRRHLCQSGEEDYVAFEGEGTVRFSWGEDNGRQSAWACEIRTEREGKKGEIRREI